MIAKPHGCAQLLTPNRLLTPNWGLGDKDKFIL